MFPAEPDRPSLVEMASTRGRAVAQMGLAGHGHRGVGDSVGQFGQGVAGAGSYQQQVQRRPGPQRLCLDDGAHGFLPAQGLQAGGKVRGRAEPGVRLPAAGDRMGTRS